jgi:hypothetical protein
MPPVIAPHAHLRHDSAQAKFDGATVVQAGGLGRLRISQAIKALFK